MLAPLFHITSLPISIVLLYFKWFNLKLRTALSLWVISIGLFVTNLNTKIFSRLEYSLLETYTSESVYERYSAVNRLDFLLFSILFTCLFLFLYNYTEDKATYNILIKLYLILNTYFLLLGFIAFNDRIAAYSWMLIPLILFKSIPNSTNERYKVTLLTLAFLLSMIFTGSMDVVIRAF